MTRRPSNPFKTYTSHEYNQKVVPLISEMSRAKHLRAESTLLMEKNLSVLYRLESSNEPDDCRSLSLDSSLSTLPTSPSRDLSPISMRSQSLDQTRIAQPPLTAILKKTPIPLTILEAHPRARESICDTVTSVPHIDTTPQSEKLQPLSRPVVASSLTHDAGEELLSPEASYMEYLRMHKSLPQLRSTPSISLLQGTVATSLKKQSIPEIDMVITVSMSEIPASSVLAGTTSLLKRKKQNATAPLASSHNDSSPLLTLRCTSPLDGYSPSTMVYKRRNSTGTPTPSPSNQVQVLSNVIKKRAPTARRHSTSNSKLFSATCPNSNTYSSVDILLTRSNPRPHLEAPRRIKRAMIKTKIIMTEENEIDISTLQKDVEVAQREVGEKVDWGQDNLDIPITQMIEERLAVVQHEYNRIPSDDQIKENKAARIIVGLFLRRRAARSASLKILTARKICHMSKFYSIVVRRTLSLLQSIK